MSPYLLLAAIIGGTYGAAFHIWQAQRARDIFYYLPAGIVGFGAGQAIAGFIGGQFLMLGPLHLAEASVVCWAGLFLARWLRGK